jgi:hypothetical protein
LVPFGSDPQRDIIIRSLTWIPSIIITTGADRQAAGTPSA